MFTIEINSDEWVFSSYFPTTFHQVKATVWDRLAKNEIPLDHLSDWNIMGNTAIAQQLCRVMNEDFDIHLQLIASFVKPLRLRDLVVTK
jgi:hypothetical protein